MGDILNVGVRGIFLRFSDDCGKLCSTEFGKPGGRGNIVGTSFRFNIFVRFASRLNCVTLFDSSRFVFASGMVFVVEAFSGRLEV